MSLFVDHILYFFARVNKSRLTFYSSVDIQSNLLDIFFFVSWFRLGPAHLGHKMRVELIGMCNSFFKNPLNSAFDSTDIIYKGLSMNHAIGPNSQRVSQKVT